MNLARLLRSSRFVTPPGGIQLQWRDLAHIWRSSGCLPDQLIDQEGS
jgi:hypothetical protein